MLTLTPDGIVAVAALFKAGGYRCYANYWSAVKSEHIEVGHLWTEQLELTGRWVTRSVLRGIGPARQRMALPLHKLLKLKNC